MDRWATADTMNRLREIARTLSVARDLDASLEEIVVQTTAVLAVDSCTIYLLDPDRETLRLRASSGLAQRALGRSTLHVGEGMTGAAVAENRPIHATDAQNDPHFKAVDEAEEMGFQSLLAAPLVVEEKPMGAINVQTREPHAFSQAEIDLLVFIADLAAGALYNAQLYERQARQLEELRTLAQVSEAVTAPQYLEEILSVITDMAARTMGATVCSIFLLDESGSQLELRAARHSESYQSRPPLALGEGALGWVAAKGKPLYISDCRSDKRYIGQALARQEGLVSLLAVPLTVRERVIGVLACYTGEPRRFTKNEKTLFATLANQTALAIENAQLVTNAAVVREMHHRIKNNLQTVAMLMQLQIPDAEKLSTREVLETNMNRIQSIATVHEVLSEKGFRLADMRDILQRIVRLTVEALAPAGMQIGAEVLGEAIALPSREATALALVVNELVLNSLEHGFRGRTNGRLTISLGRSPQQIILIVRDDGVGLADGWEKGLGLEIVETLVESDLRGRLKFNRLQPGTEVTVRMPRDLETGG